MEKSQWNPFVQLTYTNTNLKKAKTSPGLLNILYLTSSLPEISCENAEYFGYKNVHLSLA
jgi:hypothetical protein